MSTNSKNFGNASKPTAHPSVPTNRELPDNNIFLYYSKMDAGFGNAKEAEVTDKNGKTSTVKYTHKASSKNPSNYKFQDKEEVWSGKESQLATNGEVKNTNKATASFSAPKFKY